MSEDNSILEYFVGTVTRQEKIREGIRTSILENTQVNLQRGVVWKINGLSNFLSFLRENGVVRKVKCPDCAWSQFGDEAVGMSPCHSCNSTGYTIEPLVEVKVGTAIL